MRNSMSAFGHSVRQKFTKSQSVRENRNKMKLLSNILKCTNLIVSNLTHTVLLNSTDFTASILNKNKTKRREDQNTEIQKKSNITYVNPPPPKKKKKKIETKRRKRKEGSC